MAKRKSHLFYLLFFILTCNTRTDAVEAVHVNELYDRCVLFRENTEIKNGVHTYTVSTYLVHTDRAASQLQNKLVIKDITIDSSTAEKLFRKNKKILDFIGEGKPFNVLIFSDHKQRFPYFLSEAKEVKSYLDKYNIYYVYSKSGFSGSARRLTADDIPINNEIPPPTE